MDVPLRPPGAAGGRRLRGAQDGAGAVLSRPGQRLLALGPLMERLESFLARAAKAARVCVVALEPLAGGAIQDNRHLRAAIKGGPFAGELDAVLRMDAPSSVAISHDRAREFQLLKAAHGAGVKVAEPLWLCPDKTVLGRPFFVMRRMPGVAAGHRLVKDAAEKGYGEALAAELGAEAAKIHKISVPRADLSFLAAPV
ncbi:MAG: hypothetical protein FJX42_09015, partial [Alphaproteobacteria bacterium]|nr:hypothetical protein [Alphaproteobacteria bacterium]